MLGFSQAEFKTIRRVAVISDSALGFGSPDINALADGLCARFGAEGLLVQPDDINRPIVDLKFTRNVRSVRLFSILPTYTKSWRWLFFRRAAQEVDRFKPDLVVAVGPNGYGAAMAMRHKPRIMAYYMLEMATNDPLFAELHQLGVDRFDCFVIPDIERHVIDFTNMKWPKDVMFERILLTAPIDYPNKFKILPAGQRKKNFIYFGSIHPEETLLDSLIMPEMDPYNIEFYGRISGVDRAAVADRISASPNKSYGGLLTPEEMAAALPEFRYSIVSWKPEGAVARYHLPATKLYHSILAGVPVIAVPNPLNSYWIGLLGCGILLDGWSRAAFVKGFRQALEMVGTEAYRVMVENCRAAAEGELVWETQVDRVAALISRTLDKKWIKRTRRRSAADLEEGVDA